MTAWFAAAAISDVLEVKLGARLGSAQAIANVWVLASVILAIEALAAGPTAYAKARRFRVLACAYALLWVILHLTIEPLVRYSTYSSPLHAIVILMAAAFVLAQRVGLGRSDTLVDPLFLIAAGLCGYAVAAVFVTLVAQLWQMDHQSYALGYYAACNIITSLAELLIIRALFLSSSPPTRSGNLAPA